MGPGDSGKTTILDAIDLCLGARRNVSFSDTDFWSRCDSAHQYYPDPGVIAGCAEDNGNLRQLFAGIQQRDGADTGRAPARAGNGFVSAA